MKKLFLIFVLLVGVSAVPLRAQFLLNGVQSVTVADLVIDEAMKYIGTPYHWGGKSPKGFDCAGFTRYIYGKFDVVLPPSAAPQYRIGDKVDAADICKGDLVFYGGSGGGKAIGHVGIVTSVDSNGFSFIHAASNGIIISSSREPYYVKRYKGACRVVQLVVSNLPANEKAVPKEETPPVPVYRQGSLMNVE